MALPKLGSGSKPARLPVPPRKLSTPKTVKGRPSVGGKGNKRG